MVLKKLVKYASTTCKAGSNVSYQKCLLADLQKVATLEVKVRSEDVLPAFAAVASHTKALQTSAHGCNELLQATHLIG